MKHPVVTAVLIAAALSVAPAFAQQKTTKKPMKTMIPPLASAQPLQLPPVVTRTLTNGLTLVVLENHAQPALWMRLAVPAGSVRDPNGKTGLAQMAADLLSKGTAIRTEDQIADTVDGLGASLGASPDDDYITVAASGLSVYKDTLFDLLADVTRNPVFADAEIARYRTRTKSAIQSDLADAGNLASAAIARVVYGAHPYGNYATGTPETLDAISRADLKQFHQTFFAPNKATLFLTGDITVEQAVAQAERVFSTWEKRDVPAAPAPPPVFPGAGEKLVPSAARPQITIVDRPGAAQTEIRVGVLTPGYNDPRRISGQVATAVLGLGQFEGRLTREIRVKRGLTYGAASFFSRNADAGVFEMSTFTKNASTAEALQIALDEAQKLAKEPPPMTELNDRKTFLLGSFAVGVATPDGVLARLVPAVLYGNGPEDLTRYTSRVESVTPQQVEEVMQSLPLAQSRVVLVGDASQIRESVEKIGDVTVIPQSQVSLTAPDLTAPVVAVPAVSDADTTALRLLLEKTVQAHGGDKFLSMNSLMAEGSGEITPPGAGADTKFPLEKVTLRAKSPGKSRLDLKSAFGEFSFAAMGADKGGWISALGSIQDVPADMVGSSDPTALLRRAYTEKLPLQPVAEKTVDGKTLPGFIIARPNGPATTVYVDPDTTLVQQLVARSPQGETTTYLSEYKNVDGIQLPTKMRVTQGETDFLNVTWSTFAPNAPIEDSIFDKPK